MAYTIKAKLTSPPTGRTDGAGIDHDIWIAVEGVDGDVDYAHSIFSIPNDRFSELLVQMTDLQRGNLYKALVREFYGSLPVALARPAMPSSLYDLNEWNDYFDAVEEYNTNLDNLTTSASTMATQAKNWIESLSNFESWPYPFTLQIG